MSPTGRLLAALLGLGLLVLLVVASRLTPDPRGFGTHEQLGLTPCSFYRWTGWRCPTCGATTAWAHLADGQFAAAVRTHVAGTILGCLAVVAVPWLLVSAARGRWLVSTPSVRLALVLATAIAAVALLDWCQRVWQ